MQAHVIADGFVVNGSLLGFAGLYPTYVVVNKVKPNISSTKREQCVN